MNDQGRSSLLSAALISLMLLYFPAVHALEETGRGDEVSVADKVTLVADTLIASMMEEHQIPGLSLAVVLDGDVALLKGYGYVDLENQVPVDPRKHLFRIGSSSKTITWTAVMQLVEQGRIDLDEDINTYLKSFQIPQAHDRPITMNDLMAHRAGFEEWGTGIFVGSSSELIPMEEYLQSFMPERVLAPGEAVAYSNYGVALAGFIVQEVSGQPFDEYVDEHIFKPLGMRSSTFREPVDQGSNSPRMSEELQDRAVTGYVLSGGVHAQFPSRFASVIAPAGSAYSTAEDMSRYIRAYLNGGELEGNRILQASTISRMRTRNFQDRLRMDDFAHGFFNGKSSGHQYFGHGGATLTFRTVMDYYPELGFGVVATINQAGGHKALAKLPALMVEQLFPPVDSFELPVSLDPSAVDLSAYAGSYEGNRRAFTNLERLFNLFSPATQITADGTDRLLISIGGETTAWVQVGPLLFREQYGDEVIQFEASAEGRIVRFSAPMGHNSYDRVTYSATASFFKLSVGALLLFSITTLLGVWRRGVVQPPLTKAMPEKVATAAALSCLAWLLFAVAAIVNLYTAPGWFPQPMVVVFAWASLVLCVVLLTLAASVPGAWSAASGWSLLRKLHHTLFAVSGLLSIFAFWQWNLNPVFV